LPLRLGGRKFGRDTIAGCHIGSSRGPSSTVSVREARQGIKAARFIEGQLGRRGHATTLVDPLERRLPLLDRMYKEYKKARHRRYWRRWPKSIAPPTAL
jgi:hypothetical protein